VSRVIDLDILRPEPNLIKIGGKEIDVSFIPCGITFDLDAVVQELLAFTQDELKGDRVKQKQAFGLSVKLCALFSQSQYPEMDEAWFMKHTTANQINSFASEIQGTLIRIYSEVGAHSKN
jgi:hypothetical protein